MKFRIAPLPFLSVLLFGSSYARAEDEYAAIRAQVEAIGALKAEGTIVAKVGQESIDVAEVNQLLRQSLRERSVPKAALPMLMAQSLEQVIQKHLVSQYLDQQKVTVTPAEIDAAYDRVSQNLQKQGVGIGDFLSRRNMSKEEYRQQLAWEERWAKYLAAQLTDEELEKFFEANRAHYDGTELRLSQILLRPSGEPSEEKTKALVAKAEQIRQEIGSGQVTFAQAAERYSDAPSRRRGGDMGFIPRNGVMEETFSTAAFNLRVGEISPPLVTPFGVHLLQCTEMKLGKKSWRESRQLFERAAVEDTFNRIANAMRQSTQVEYTGAIAHFKPGTTDLVQPDAASNAKEAAVKDAPSGAP